jgi:S-adenosylmethionine:tRNA ribosyltransferase-isomerase
MNIADFDYELPPGAVAQEPAPERDASRLLHLDRRTGLSSHHVFRELPDLLKPGDLLVLNRSRVFPARLLGRRPTGGAAEVFLLRDLGEDRWEAFVHPGRRLRPGDLVHVDENLTVVLESYGRGEDHRRLVQLRAGDGDVARALATAGRVPLPPYVQRPATDVDRERYQTVYARESGSVAAPTAGLHFTEALLRRLNERGLRTADIVLHVGPGTFKPVAVEDVCQHRVEPEPYFVPEETAQAVAETRARGGRVIAVGTTAARTLETVAEPEGRIRPGRGETSLVIVPGFEFRAVDALLTNFHLPRSSLLLLVAAFAGRERILAAYAEALRLGYRVYSYGDAMLLE